RQLERIQVFQLVEEIQTGQVLDEVEETADQVDAGKDRQVAHHARGVGSERLDHRTELFGVERAECPLLLFRVGVLQRVEDLGGELDELHLGNQQQRMRRRIDA